MTVSNSAIRAITPALSRSVFVQRLLMLSALARGASQIPPVKSPSTSNGASQVQPEWNRTYRE
jgi:hypothetical protein